MYKHDAHIKQAFHEHYVYVIGGFFMARWYPARKSYKGRASREATNVLLPRLVFACSDWQ